MIQEFFGRPVVGINYFAVAAADPHESTLHLLLLLLLVAPNLMPKQGCQQLRSVNSSARCVRCFLLQLSIYQTPYGHKNKQINQINAMSKTCTLCSPAFSSVARQVLNTVRIVGTRDVRRYYRRLNQNNSAASSRRRRNGSLPARRSSRNSRIRQAAAAACKQRRRNILAAATAAAT